MSSQNSSNSFFGMSSSILSHASRRLSGAKSSRASSSGAEGDEKDNASQAKMSQHSAITDKKAYKGGNTREAWTGESNMDVLHEHEGEHDQDDDEHVKTASRIKQYQFENGDVEKESQDQQQPAAPEQGLDQIQHQASHRTLQSDAPEPPFIPISSLEELIDDMQSYEVDGIRYKTIAQSAKALSGKLFGSRKSRTSVVADQLGDNDGDNYNIQNGGYMVARSQKGVNNKKHDSGKIIVDKLVDV